MSGETGFEAPLGIFHPMVAFYQISFICIFREKHLGEKRGCNLNRYNLNLAGALGPLGFDA